MMSKSKKSILLFGLTAVMLILAGVYTQQSKQTGTKLPQLAKTVILPNSKALSYVDFVDHQGEKFTASHLQGYWSIVFFGFTNCPDICPTTMRTLKLVKDRLSESNNWGNYQVIMVSVDPDRDTTERLNDYVPYFDKDFIGLNSDVTTITEFAKQMGILFFKTQTDNDFYEVDHSASLILVNPAGEMAGVITAPHKADQISGDLTLLAEHFSADHETTLEKEIVRNTNQPQVKTQAISQELNGDKLGKNSVIDGLVMSDAWVRPAPPNATSMAAYFSLTNQSNSVISIVEANSNDFTMVMIHQTVIEDDLAKMQRITELTIAPGETVTLQPLGTHAMLMQPKRTLELGDEIELTLITESGSSLTQAIEVKPLIQ